MSPPLKVGTAVTNHVKRYTLNEKLNNILGLLGNDGQQVIDWAYEEAERRISEDKSLKKSNLGGIVFDLLGYE
ncbi:MAG: hypothetical protein E4H14_05960, partial [Candidatus Thorarchaeota archaeon]